MSGDFLGIGTLRFGWGLATVMVLAMSFAGYVLWCFIFWILDHVNITFV